MPLGKSPRAPAAAAHLYDVVEEAHKAVVHATFLKQVLPKPKFRGHLLLLLQAQPLLDRVHCAGWIPALLSHLLVKLPSLSSRLADLNRVLGLGFRP
jgi:hypothetical protein